MKKKLSAIILLLLVCVLTFGIFGCAENESKSETPVPGKVFEVTVIGGEGSGVYHEGSICTAIAENLDNLEFKGWFADDVKISVEKEYKFEVKKDVTITAKYGESASKVKLTISGGYEQESGLSELSVENGTSVTIVAAENQTRTFVSWSIDGGEPVTDNPYTFTVDGDTEVIATFDKLCMVIVENGKVSGESNLFREGEECTVIADEGTGGDEFAYWYYETPQGKEEIVSEEPTYTFTVENTISLKVKYLRFSEVTVTGGTIKETSSASARVERGSLCTLVPDAEPENMKFKSWSVDGVEVSTKRIFEFVTSKPNHEIVANFAEVTEKIPALENTWQGFNWWSPNGTTAGAAEFFRYGRPSTLFNKADHLVYYVYTSQDADLNDYIAKFYVYNTESGYVKDELVSEDGTHRIAYDGGSGDACVQNANNNIEKNFHPFMEYVIGENFDPMQNYYFAIQQIGKVVGDNVYGDSDISPIGLGAYNRDGEKVRVPTN